MSGYEHTCWVVGVNGQVFLGISESADLVRFFHKTIFRATAAV